MSTAFYHFFIFLNIYSIWFDLNSCIFIHIIHFIHLEHTNSGAIFTEFSTKVMHLSTVNKYKI